MKPSVLHHLFFKNSAFCFITDFSCSSFFNVSSLLIVANGGLTLSCTNKQVLSYGPEKGGGICCFKTWTHLCTKVSFTDVQLTHDMCTNVQSPYHMYIWTVGWNQSGGPSSFSPQSLETITSKNKFSPFMKCFACIKFKTSIYFILHFIPAQYIFVHFTHLPTHQASTASTPEFTSQSTYISFKSSAPPRNHDLSWYLLCFIPLCTKCCPPTSPHVGAL